MVFSLFLIGWERHQLGIILKTYWRKIEIKFLSRWDVKMKLHGYLAWDLNLSGWFLMITSDWFIIWPYMKDKKTSSKPSKWSSTINKTSCWQISRMAMGSRCWWRFFSRPMWIQALIFQKYFYIINSLGEKWKSLISAKTNANNGTACYERVSKYHFMSGSGTKGPLDPFRDISFPRIPIFRPLSGCCSADGYAFAPSWIKARINEPLVRHVNRPRIPYQGRRTRNTCQGTRGYEWLFRSIRL